jgi:hypothetical protein
MRGGLVRLRRDVDSLERNGFALGTIHPQKQHPQDLQGLRDRVGRRVPRLQISETWGEAQTFTKQSVPGSAQPSANLLRPPFHSSTSLIVAMRSGSAWARALAAEATRPDDRTSSSGAPGNLGHLQPG